MSDGRKKACPNSSCEVHKKKKKFSAKEMNCPECGADLVYVCKRCGKEIADEGPEHKICPICEAEKADNRERAKQLAATIGAGAAALAAFAVQAKDTVPKVVEKAPELIKTLRK